MILTALAELAEWEGLVRGAGTRSDGLASHADYQPVAVRWLATINPDGQMVGPFEDTAGGRSDRGTRGKVNPVMLVVPKRSSRTYGVRAEFIVDNVKYALGWVDPKDLVGKTDDEAAAERLKVADCHRAFIREVELAADKTGDEALLALLTFLRNRADSPSPSFPDRPGKGDSVGFVYSVDGMLISSRPRVVEYWAARRFAADRRGRVKVKPASVDLQTRHVCLVTGEACVPVTQHAKPKGLPPETGGVYLTSVNEPKNPSFASYLLGGIANAPISQSATDAVEKALNRLLADGNYPNPADATPMPRRNVRLADDTVVVFWSKGDPTAVDLFGDAVGLGDPEAVGALYRAVWKDKPVDLHDPAAFYALTLTGGQGRGTVRGWHEARLKEVLANVKEYFDDIEIVGRDPGRPRPLLGLVASLAVRNKPDNAPSGLAADLFAAALAGRPFPHEVLAAAVRRTRVEKDGRYQRFDEWQRLGLIRGHLVRARRHIPALRHLPEVKPMVDETCPTPAYRLGRLFAVLEKLQMDALRNLNATIRDRYYGAASATPVVVFPLLIRMLPHHLKNSRRPGFFERLTQEIMDELPAVAFPSVLTLEHQGLFALGYFQESKALFDPVMNARRRARFHTAEPDPDTDAPTAPTDTPEGS